LDPAPPLDKSAVRDRIVAELRSELERQTQAANLARDEAISEESRPENKYDTHSQEAAYLAEGQARLAAEIAETIALYEALPVAPAAPDALAAVGSLIELNGRRGSRWYFLGPRRGGIEFDFAGAPVLVLTPQSPLGRQLVGRRAGDPVQLPGASGMETRVVRIV